MDSFAHDLRYAARQLVRAPGFTAVVVATLALGIGANSALFTLTSAMLLRPLPGIAHSDELVWVSATRGPGGHANYMSYPDYLELVRGAGKLLAGSSVVADAHLSISRNGDPENVRGQLVSGGYFSLLGVPMAAGRGFSAAEDSAALVRPVAVISYSLWSRRFDSDLGVIGKTLIVNGHAFTIVGVTASGFNGADLEMRRDVWLPVTAAPIAMPSMPNLMRESTSWWLTSIARLAPGVAPRQVDAVLRGVARQIVHADSIGHGGFDARTFSAHSGMPPSSLNEIVPLAALATLTTGLVLLIACANVSNLLLARSASRRREIAIRLSLGASRRRIVRQLLSESLLIAGVASGAGLIAAMWGADLLVSTSVLPLSLDLSIDGGVLAFSLIAAILTALVFGLAPALDATRPSVTSALKDAMPGGDVRRSRLQSGFVIAQVSLSFVLLIVAGVFLRSLHTAATVDVGFDAGRQVLSLSFDLTRQGYDESRALNFLRAVRDRAVGMPGVEAVSLTDQVPFSERHFGGEATTDREARVLDPARRVPSVAVFVSNVRPNYFRALGLPLVLGRDFSDADSKGSALVAIVSEDYARTAWPNANPIGQRVSMNGRAGPFHTVIGVARQSFMTDVGERPRGEVYLAHLQHPGFTELSLIVRAHGDAATLASALRNEIHRMDRDLPVYLVQTMAQYREDSLQKYRIGSRLIGMFGALALLLASLGVYAVMAFAVTLRTREIGVRVALGAMRHQVVGLFVQRGMRLASIGLVIGTLLSIGVARVVASLLVVASPTDVVPFVAVLALLGTVILLASWVPARRAARVDAMEALRHE
jgi:putative ABC transport system permease protein